MTEQEYLDFIKDLKLSVNEITYLRTNFEKGNEENWYESADREIALQTISLYRGLDISDVISIKD